MTAFVVDKRSAGPGTHALVIGVNDYPHEPRAGTMKWPPLTSPVPSATRFADWLRRSHRNDEAPLKSLQVLLSPGPLRSGGEDFAVPNATFDNIRAAFAEWWNACAGDDQNVGIFYFCGHGCEPRELCLLAEDAGADPQNPWENFINFNLTYDAMKRNPAHGQIFFLDACREIPREMFKDEAQIGRPLRRPVTDGMAVSRDAPIYLAAGVQGATAAGNVGQPSLFTQGLVDCLDRFGASHRDGTNPWVVNTSSLREALGEFMSRQETNDLDPTSGARSDFSLAQAVRVHEIHGPCQALTNLRLSEPLASSATEIAVHGPVEMAGPPAGASWRTALLPGSYRVTAQSTAFEDTEQQETVAPPVRNIWVPRRGASLRAR